MRYKRGVLTFHMGPPDENLVELACDTFKIHGEGSGHSTQLNFGEF